MSLPQYISVGENRFPLHVRRSKAARRLSLRFHPLQDALYLTVPRRCSAEYAEAFVKSRREWLREHLKDIPARVPLTFGSTIPVLGKPVTIVPSNDNKIRWVRHQSNRYADARLLAIPATRPEECEAMVRDELERKLHAYVSHRAGRVAGTLQRKVRRIVLRDMVTRWGSCTRDGTLTFSWRLVFAPRAVLDYVIAHEASHLRRMDHSRGFWSIVEDLCPSHDRRRNWLHEQAFGLYRYGRKTG